MNYNNDELIEALAAEFALGTLHGRARDRMAGLMRSSSALRNAVWQWEAQLSEMGLALPQLEAPPQIWPAIERRIKPVAPTPINSRQTTRIWRNWSAFATAAAVLLAVFIFGSKPPTTLDADRVAVFVNTEAQPQWLVRLDLQNGKISARALNVQASQIGSAFELWMLPGGNAAPRSLGLLPTNSQALQAKLSSDVISTLQKTAVLAVSLEPAGGSPTGLPTGPVLYQAPILQL